MNIYSGDGTREELREGEGGEGGKKREEKVDMRGMRMRGISSTRLTAVLFYAPRKNS